MQKLWYSISYKRIVATWGKYGALDDAHHGFVPNGGTASGFLDLLNQLKKAQEWGGVRAVMLLGCQARLLQCQQDGNLHGTEPAGGYRPT